MKLIFEQVQYALWTEWCPIVGFAISFTVFVFCIVRALRMPKDTVERQAALPLEES